MDVNDYENTKSDPNYQELVRVTLLPRVDAVADHAGHLLRLHPAGRLCTPICWGCGSE